MSQEMSLRDFFYLEDGISIIQETYEQRRARYSVISQMLPYEQKNLLDRERLQEECELEATFWDMNIPGEFPFRVVDTRFDGVGI